MSTFGVPIIGIIGGIGAGKSAVARELGKHFSVHLLDADKAGHRVLLDQTVKATLAAEFGDQILDEHGEIMRKEIAKLVFGNSPSQLQARAFLDLLIHPAIRSQLEAELVQAIETGVELVVLDAALLLEAGWNKLCDVIVFLETPLEVRLERVQQRGWSEEDLLQRELSQLSLVEKQKYADFVLKNSGPLEQVGRELADYIQKRFFKVDSNPVPV